MKDSMVFFSFSFYCKSKGRKGGSNSNINRHISLKITGQKRERYMQGYKMGRTREKKIKGQRQKDKKEIEK